ncbi:hypothetical protein PRIPAC_83825 [Pristionchus pacificus]|uniref:Uncharacterized protein n=1 Tax=Pristionchus pacificus TaxID=54126 RepID=A0A2A6BVJ7_PRIPA|nr:hypothetical protein PRIPAC_83825 [Pristionchus pacificus]|eukprot:PDM69781.1 hypothetical protein PRIPAC_44877 [Pristionchus pacificus]
MFMITHPLNDQERLPESMRVGAFTVHGRDETKRRRIECRVGEIDQEEGESSENGSDERSGRMAEAGLLSKMTSSIDTFQALVRPRHHPQNKGWIGDLSESPSARHSIDRGDTVARAPSLAKLAQVPPLRRARKSSELPSHPDSPFIDRHCSSVRVLQTAIRLVVSGMDVLGNNIVSLLAKIITRGSAPVIPPVLQSPG